MTKIYDKNGNDTGLDWSEAPEWANVLIADSCGVWFIWTTVFEVAGQHHAEPAKGNYPNEKVSYGEYHCWTLISERPKEQEWEVGDELEFLGGKQYFHTGFFIKDETYTIGGILDTGYNLNRGSYSAFWSSTTIKKCFKRINKTKEEQKVTEMKSVRDVDHLEELMNKGVDVWYNCEKVLSMLKRPEGSKSGVDVTVFTDQNSRSFNIHGIAGLKYKPTKIRRFYQTGDWKEDIIRVNDHNDKIVALYDLSTDYPDADYPVMLGIVRETYPLFFNTFNKDQIIVEVEE